MNDRLVVLERYGDPVQAQAARAALELAGIRAVIADEQIAINLRHLSSGLKGAELLVHEHNLDRATRVLIEAEEAADKETRHKAWNCFQCGERVPAEFDECWSCGQAFADGADKSTSTLSPITGVTLEELDDDDSEEEGPGTAPTAVGWRCFSCGREVLPYTTTCTDCGGDAGVVNPYVSTTAPVRFRPPSVNSDKLAEKALVAAFMGLMCPIVITLYSMYLIFQIFSSGEGLSGRGRAYYCAAIVINFLIVIIYLCMFGQRLVYSYY